MFFAKSFIAAGGLAALAQAHMLLRIPPPYTSPALQSGPLDPSGSNYPCQAAAGATFAGTATKMEKGSKQKMGFTGSAVHGGGSCQISITYDNPPTAKSVFKVIHSIQGGCPARGVAGNAGNDPNAQAKDEYEFTIPEDIPTGNATLAWSWLNKIGNREFYMNCAPVDITGSEGSQAALAALPDMLIANIAPGNGCSTKEGVDIEFPNPGKSVETNPGAALGPPEGNCGGKAAGGGSGGSSSGAAAAAVPAVRGRRATRSA
ncbi:hypothetical protein VTI74DRAFT_97 [Chaetomium olivicolor]